MRFWRSRAKCPLVVINDELTRVIRRGSNAFILKISNARKRQNGTLSQHELSLAKARLLVFW
jgi:hypothetical protein